MHRTSSPDSVDRGWIQEFHARGVNDHYIQEKAIKYNSSGHSRH